MEYSLFMLFFGLGLLLCGGFVLIPGIIALANLLKIPARIIAFVLVAGGTSMPELIVSIDAAYQASPGIVWGNILGSNIANTLLVLGLGTLITPIICHTRETKIDLYLMMAVTILMCFFLVNGGITSSRWLVSFGLIGGFISYIVYLIFSANQENNKADPVSVPPLPLWRTLLYSIGGIAGLLIGADFFVKSGIDIAHNIGLSEVFIGLTIIAIGTSLPEIISVVASLIHKRSDIALGNVLGSNLFNMTAILGAAALVAELPITLDAIILPALLLLASTLVIFIFSALSYSLSRYVGLVFIGLYIGFLFIQTIIYNA